MLGYQRFPRLYHVGTRSKSVIDVFSCLPLATVESWDHTLSVNARGPYLCYKYAAMQMIEQGRGGRIIGASSVLGKMGASYRHNFA
jgi:NAD(P)-dependent dehydrogenase (short-subunit alcohol dehydrogenase family)